MNCDVCGHPFHPARPGVVPYECGLPVTLLHVPVEYCTNCDNYAVEVPRVAELNQQIAVSVATKASRLMPAEVRFLRKYLGWSGADMARRFAVKPETVSRWETGKLNMAGPAERLLRVLALHEKPVERYEDLDALLLHLKQGKREPEALQVSAMLRDNAWELQTA